MDVIKVKKLDHAKLYLEVESGTAQELSEYFSFFVPGYKFMPPFRNGVWDGKIRLFTNNRNLPVGLYDSLIYFCESRDYKLELIESEYGLPNDKDELDINFLKDFIDKLELTAGGNPIQCRDYQFNAICEALVNKRNILLSPTGSGKSLIIYIIARYLLTKVKKKILIIVPTTSLVQQMYSDFEDYGLDSAKAIHRIYSGKEKNTNQPIVVSTWQSIYKLPKKWFDQFSVIFGDEVHGFKSKSLVMIMDKASEVPYRFGTTGTLDGKLVHELTLQGSFGPVYKVTTTQKLQQANTLAQLNINIISLLYPEEIRELSKKLTYQQELDYVVTHPGRNKFLSNLALDQKGNTLLLFQFVEKHGKKLFELIENCADKGRKVYFISGATESADREAIRKIVEKEKNAIICASFGVFSTGINIKNLHNIIFASPSKSPIRVLQSIGRGLRKSDNNQETQLLDVCDDLHWRKHKNYLLGHAAERIKLYEKENFKYKIYNINIE